MNVYETVTQIFADSFEVPADRITAATTLRDLDLDSLELVELSLVLEKEFGVKLTDEQLAESTLDVGRLCAAISAAQGAEAR